MVIVGFFFFKQKTAYEITYGDWSSDVCSSDLLLGETGEDLGGTEYLRAVHHREQGTPPVLNLEREAALQRVVLQAVEQGLVRSAHDCAEGGVAVALAESCLSATNGPLGAEIVLDRHGLRRDSLLFGESQSRI